MASKKTTASTTPRSPREAIAQAQAAGEFEVQHDGPGTEPPVEHDGHTISVGFPDEPEHVPYDPTDDIIQANADMGDHIVALEGELGTLLVRFAEQGAALAQLRVDHEATLIRLREFELGAVAAIIGDGLAPTPIAIDGERFGERAARLEGRAAELEAFKEQVVIELGRIIAEARGARIEQRAAGE